MWPNLENLPEGIFTLNGVVISIESPFFKELLRLKMAMSMCLSLNFHLTALLLTLNSKESMYPLV